MEVSNTRLNDISSLMIICPSESTDNTEPRSGANFLQKHSAWGYVRVAKDPVYFALYEAAPTSAITFFGVVDRIIGPTEEDSPERRTKEAKEAESEGKKVILLKKGTVKQLRSPIKFKKNNIQSVQYSNLSKFLKAKTTDDLR